LNGIAELEDMGVYAAKECNRSIWAVVTDTRFGEIVPER